MMDSDAGLLEKVATAMKNNSDSSALSEVLSIVVEAFGCTTGTVHLLDEKSGMLKLTAQRGIPAVVLDKIKMIPVGKGMAGIAAERRESVQVCNLQTDSSGVVRPGARDTKMEGSVATPMLNTDGVLKGTLGIAKPVPYDFTAEECDLLLKAGRLIADRVEP